MSVSNGLIVSVIPLIAVPRCTCCDNEECIVHEDFAMLAIISPTYWHEAKTWIALRRQLAGASAANADG